MYLSRTKLIPVINGSIPARIFGIVNRHHLVLPKCFFCSLSRGQNRFPAASSNGYQKLQMDHRSFRGAQCSHFVRGYSTSSSEIIDNQNQLGSRELGESTLFLQEGTEIQEIPLAVIRDSAECRSNEGKIGRYDFRQPNVNILYLRFFQTIH